MRLLRAIAATTVFSLALGVANGVATILEHKLAWERPATSLVQAVLCSSLTLAGVLWLARQTGMTSASFGLHRPGLGRDLGLGLAVVLVSAGIVIGIAAMTDLVTVNAVRPGTLVVFMLTTVVVAFGFEAFPEELAFRGFAFSSLRTGWSTGWAAVGATVLFVAAPGLSLVVSSTVEWALADGPRPGWAAAPAGEDPVVYLVFLIVWSVCLLSARLLTGSIWTGVAAHLAMLIINRLLLSPTSGLEVRLAHPDVALILPAYVLLAALGFVLLRRHRNRPAQIAMVEEHA